jgi:hypothetical protein
VTDAIWYLLLTAVPMGSKVKDEKEEHDLVWGASQIAAVINRTRSQTFHILESGELPARKVSGRWVASRKRLLAHFTGEDA